MEGDNSTRDESPARGVLHAGSKDDTSTITSFKNRFSRFSRPSSFGPSKSSTVSPSSSLRPVSCGSVTPVGAKTLVHPRPWRFLHRAKMGASQGRVEEEDSTLEGDPMKESEGHEMEQEGHETETCLDRDAANTSYSNRTHAQVETRNESAASLKIALSNANSKCEAEVKTEVAEVRKSENTSDTVGDRSRKLQSEVKNVTFRESDVSAKEESEPLLRRPARTTTPQSSERSSILQRGKKDEDQPLLSNSPRTPTEETRATYKKEFVFPNRLPLALLRKSSTLPPSSPEEDVLFSLGYTKVDDVAKSPKCTDDFKPVLSTSKTNSIETVVKSPEILAMTAVPLPETVQEKQKEDKYRQTNRQVGEKKPPVVKSLVETEVVSPQQVEMKSTVQTEVKSPVQAEVKSPVQAEVKSPVQVQLDLTPKNEDAARTLSARVRELAMQEVLGNSGVDTSVDNSRKSLGLQNRNDADSSKSLHSHNAPSALKKSDKNDGGISPQVEGAASPQIEEAISPRSESAISPRSDSAISPRSESAISPRSEGVVSPRSEGPVSPPEKHVAQTHPEPPQRHQEHQQKHVPEVHQPLKEHPHQPQQQQSFREEPSQKRIPQQISQQQQQQAHVHHHQAQQNRVPPPKPRHLEDYSSSDTQTSDIDSHYGSLRRNYPASSQGQASESDGELTPTGTGSIRRAVPRRHTVAGAAIREHMQMQGQPVERKREAFYELLAHRYPQYADKITGNPHYAQIVERTPRPREPRRRTTVVTYNPALHNRSMDYEDQGTMSDLELPSFQRGGYGRASLPIVRSASSSLERPIGLVFLVYRNETKKALLPNEITTLDTVRALFVRAFPEKLTMEFLDSPKRKIYILEAATNIFFQLEELRDIKDRTVLKIHECDSDEPQRVKNYPEVRGRLVQPVSHMPRPSSRQGYPDAAVYYPEMTKAQSLPVTVGQNYQELMQKEHLLWELEQEYLQQQQRGSRSRSQTPEPAERPRSLSTGAPRLRFSHSPDRQSTPDRAAHLNPIPENPRLLANGFREAVINENNYEVLPGNNSHGYHHSLVSPTGHPSSHPQGRILSPPPPVGAPIYESVYTSYSQPQSYMVHSTRAGQPAGPQRAMPPLDARGISRSGPGNRHPLPFVSMPSSKASSYDVLPTNSYRSTPERDQMLPRPQSAMPHDLETKSRMERMEQQIATLVALLQQQHTPPDIVDGNVPRSRGPGSSRSTSTTLSQETGSTASKKKREATYSSIGSTNTHNKQGLSDIPTAYSLSRPTITVAIQDKIADLQKKIKELKHELHGLRRMEQLNQEAMRDAFADTFLKIKKVLSAVPGAEYQVLRYKRTEATSLAKLFLEDKASIEKELGDLEASVEELKSDVIARKCRATMTDVEGMALLLSNITKSLADLKARFPNIHESLKNVMSGEMEIVVKEERFLKEEPQKIEASLKRCKNLTSTLYTLKSLITVQDRRPIQVPQVANECKDVGDSDKMAILESIRAMVPDHETRVQSLEAANASRERKKKITIQQESLKFTKNLQVATKSLKPSRSEDPMAVVGQNKIMLSKSEALTHSEKEKTEKDSLLVSPCVEQKINSGSRTESPVVPVKPSRLPLDSEIQRLENATMVSNHIEAVSDAIVSPSSGLHTITVTSQISDTENKASSSPEPMTSHRTAARLAFFSSLQTSPTSNEDQPTSKVSPSVTRAKSFSTSTSLPNASSNRPSSTGLYFQAISPTRHNSAFSSIPLPNRTPKVSPSEAIKEEESSSVAGSKPKKVPPPPPPRKSSTKLPLGSSNEGSVQSINGSSGSRRDSDKWPETKKDPVLAGPLSSTPKPVTSQRPIMSRYQKDLAAGIYANMNRPDLQNQKVPPDRIISNLTSLPSATIPVSGQEGTAPDEQDLSDSESSSSSTSLDSQLGVGSLHSGLGGSVTGRKPKPNPPQRHSSLIVKGSNADHNGVTGEKNENKT